MAPEKGERSNGVCGRKGESANGRDTWWGEAPVLPETFNEAHDVVDSNATLDRSACRAVGLRGRQHAGGGRDGLKH